MDTLTARGRLSSSSSHRKLQDDDSKKMTRSGSAGRQSRAEQSRASTLMGAWVCGAFAWEAFKRLQQRSDADGDEGGRGALLALELVAHAMQPCSRGPVQGAR
jgi:hypothetical protein